MKVRLSIGDYVTVVNDAESNPVVFKVKPASYGGFSVILKAGDEPVAVNCYASWASFNPKFQERGKSTYEIGDPFSRFERRTQDESLKPYHYALDAAVPPVDGEKSQVELVERGISLDNFDDTIYTLNRVYTSGLVIATDNESEETCFISFQTTLGQIGTFCLLNIGGFADVTVNQQAGLPSTISAWTAILPFIEGFFNEPSVSSLDALCTACGVSDRLACYLFAINAPVRYFGVGGQLVSAQVQMSRQQEVFVKSIVCPDASKNGLNLEFPPSLLYSFTVRRIESIEAEIGMSPTDLIDITSAGNVYSRANPLGQRLPVFGSIPQSRHAPPCEIQVEFTPHHPGASRLFEEANSKIESDGSLIDCCYCNPFTLGDYAYDIAYYSGSVFIGQLSYDASADGILPVSGIDYTNSAHESMQEFIAQNPAIALVSKGGRLLRVTDLNPTGRVQLFYHWLDLSAHSTLQRDPTPGGAEYGVNYFFMPYGFEPIQPNSRSIINLAIFVSTDEISDYYTPDDGFELFRQDIEELQQEANLFTGDSLKIVILDRASLVTPNSQDNTCPTVDTDAPGDPLPDVSPVVNLQENDMPTGDRYIEIFEQSADGRPINRLIVVLDSSGSMRGSVLYNPINDALDELIAYVDAEYPGIQTEINNISNEAWAFNANYYISRADPSDNIVLISIINESTPYGPATAPDYGPFKSDITSLKNTLASPPCVAASVVNIDVPSLWPDAGLSDTVAPFSDTTPGSSVDRPEFITIATELEVFGDVEINGQTHDPDSRWPPIIDEFGGEVDYAYALYDTSRSARSAVDCETDANRFISLISSGNILSQSGRTKKAGFDDERWAKAVAAAIREINLVNANA